MAAFKRHRDDVNWGQGCCVAVRHFPWRKIVIGRM